MCIRDRESSPFGGNEEAIHMSDDNQDIDPASVDSVVGIVEPFKGRENEELSEISVSAVISDSDSNYDSPSSQWSLSDDISIIKNSRDVIVDMEDDDYSISTIHSDELSSSNESSSSSSSSIIDVSPFTSSDSD